MVMRPSVRSTQCARPHCLHGQAIAEYALLFAVAVAGIMGMQLYSKRAIQAGLKTAADQLSPGSVANDMCDGIVDTQGEIAQQMGVRNETGDQKFQLTMRGKILESRIGVDAVRDPADNVTNRTEVLGGSVTLTKQSKTVARGALPEGGGRSSHTVMVVDDGPAP